MTTRLVRAERSQLPLLDRLFQLYVYDFSAMLPLKIGDDGRFETPRSAESYFDDDTRHPFFIQSEGVWAGFALAHRGSRLDGDPNTWDVGEFFVMRGHRRRGVGALAAKQLFDRFAGRWEVRQIRENTRATQFWRTVVGEYTGGDFSETLHDSDRWRGPVQSFRRG
ncbi:MAG: GNAT family N-acetyltransferase [Sandaracinus sp.]|nr:GNAT family N-acetyltransferase [Sandaracinus sp.]